MVPNSLPDLSQLRILIVSPLAPPPGPFLGVQVGERESARTPDAVTAALRSSRRRFDVVLVDLMWNDFTLEWTYDGLDVLAEMRVADRHEPVILACQGHGFERDYLEEARHDPLARGMILKSKASTIIEAISAVSLGNRYFDHDLKAALHDPEATIAHHFQRSKRLARTAGVFAAGAAVDYASAASFLNVSTDTVNRAPDLFRTLLAARGEAPLDGRLTQPLLFRWCGEHSHYILSWCRRHAAVLGVAPEVFTKH